MSRVVVEDARYVEPGELGEMLKDAIERVPVDLLDADVRTFRIEQFDTNHTDQHIGASGEAMVKASLLHREGAECRVEFETMGLPDDGDGLTPMEVSLRVVEEILAE
jgi:hypothetical protein